MRPNRNRRKTTVWLGKEDDREIAELIRSGKATTTSGAVRFALSVVNQPPPDTTAIAGRILQWVGSLAFMSEREKRELRELTRELYDLVSQTAGEKAVMTRGPDHRARWAIAKRLAKLDPKQEGEP